MDWHAKARTLNAKGKALAAIPLFRKHLARNPSDRIAWHNLAGALGNEGFHAEALDAADRAAGLGLKAPETQLVRGRAALHLGRLDEAEAAFRQALAQRPGDPSAHRELAQLIWMRTSDAEAAATPLAAAFQREPQNLGLRLVVCEVLQQVAQEERAVALALDTAALAPESAEVRYLAARLLLRSGDAMSALPHAEAAFALSGQAASETELLAQVRLALGDLEEAERLLTMSGCGAIGTERVFAAALQAVIWRLKGDERYLELYDYTAKIGSYEIDVPYGWGSLSGYLDDLKADLGARHTFRNNPFNQSVKGGGSQLGNLAGLGSPALEAWPDAVAGPVRAHFASQGMKPPPLAEVKRRLKPWSVRLGPGGHHSDHIHPGGLFSSACHLAYERAGAAPEGWLRFGKPGLVLPEELDAEYLVKPEPGRLVLFPSYLWHGVVPISGQAERLTIATDVTGA
ncbi:2OG-Fe(II) oxygenase family protein [Parvularcula maris]|uniref:2OG-Fe(II) oxygenase n=1 Tax=Parvularcula maris TaxID=2965077 RepID=A0A9X2LD25_9PROT|nr:putative 2OG-Fe(II) oxygenase [Parvularcula maris]MCQ8186307.1 putative 2OG-Fe(II) oxygenase [Parvularcula maris]